MIGFLLEICGHGALSVSLPLRGAESHFLCEKQGFEMWIEWTNALDLMQRRLASPGNFSWGLSIAFPRLASFDYVPLSYLSLSSQISLDSSTSSCSSLKLSSTALPLRFLLLMSTLWHRLRSPLLPTPHTFCTDFSRER